MMARTNQVLASNDLGEILHCGCFDKVVLHIHDRWMIMGEEELSSFRDEFTRFLAKPCVRSAFRAGCVMTLASKGEGNGAELDFEGVKSFFEMVDTACLVLSAEAMARKRGIADRPRVIR